MTGTYPSHSNPQIFTPMPFAWERQLLEAGVASFLAARVVIGGARYSGSRFSGYRVKRPASNRP
jgi:hypothetical protein